MDAVIYTRQGCHLCEEAEALLRGHGLSIELIDIDKRTEFREAYHECVPVVEIDGQVRFRGRVDERLLKRLLRAGR